MNGSYDQIARRYSKETETSSMGCMNLTPFLDIKEGDIVVDLGCGNGCQTMSLGGLAGMNGRVFGIDMTPGMINAARSKNDMPNVEFMIGDIHDLPFENESVNAVISNCVINHSMEKRRIFSEIYRILKTGGHFVIGDVMSVERLPDHIACDPDNVAACWGGAIMKDDYMEIIKNCGFKDILELSSRRYYKNGFLLESLAVKGEKK